MKKSSVKQIDEELVRYQHDNHSIIMRNSRYLKELVDVCNYLPNKNNMIEIGAFQGESTRVWCEYFDHVYVIDPWETGWDNSDNASNINGVEIEDIFDKNLEKFDNFTKIRGYSHDPEVRQFFENLDEEFDFIYLDACHQYEPVKADIEYYQNLVKPSGYIGGDDYKDKWPGVKKAVNKMYGKPDRIFRKTWIKKL